LGDDIITKPYGSRGNDAEIEGSMEIPPFDIPKDDRTNDGNKEQDTKPHNHIHDRADYHLQAIQSSYFIISITYDGYHERNNII
jgi:hypothetical protein